MKKDLPIFFLSFLLIFASCKNQNDKQTTEKDSLPINQPKDETLYVEDLLPINSHEELVKKYGEKNVIKDRFHYADDVDGTPASILFKGTDKEIAIEWNDTIHYKNLNLITVGGYSKTDTSMPIYSSQWKSKTGLYIGMPLQEAKNLNGKNFVIGGLGWDYGGGVINWNGGNLTKDSNISVIFTESNTKAQLNEKELNQINGEGVQVSTSNQALQKVHPIIFRIFINKK